MGYNKRSVEGKFHSKKKKKKINLRKKKNQINNLTLHLKELEKEVMKNPRVSRRKEIIKK